jgi:hypothetical protein
MVNKKQIHKLESALYKAFVLGCKHTNAITESEKAFYELFGEDVPEENLHMMKSNNREEVGSLFNNFVNHGENMAGDSVKDLVEKMIELMENKND